MRIPFLTLKAVSAVFENTSLSPIAAVRASVPEMLAPRHQRCLHGFPEFRHSMRVAAATGTVQLVVVDLVELETGAMIASGLTFSWIGRGRQPVGGCIAGT